MTGSDKSNSSQYSEDSPRARTCILLLLLCSRGARSVVLSSYCLVPVICGVGKISDTKYVDVHVWMGWYINYDQKVPILPLKLAQSMDMLSTCARSGSTQQKYGVVVVVVVVFSH